MLGLHTIVIFFYKKVVKSYLLNHLILSFLNVKRNGKKKKNQKWRINESNFENMFKYSFTIIVKVV